MSVQGRRIRATHKLVIDQRIFDGYVSGYWSRLGNPLTSADSPGVADRREIFKRLVLNPSYSDPGRSVFFRTLIARHLARRGIINLEEN